MQSGRRSVHRCGVRVIAVSTNEFRHNAGHLLRRIGVSHDNDITVRVEGGNATLFVSPTGESLLIDSGNAGAWAIRDAEQMSRRRKPPC